MANLYVIAMLFLRNRKPKKAGSIAVSKETARSRPYWHEPIFPEPQERGNECQNLTTFESNKVKRKTKTLTHNPVEF